MRLNVLIGDRDAPAHFAGGMDGGVVPGAGGDLPETVADG